MTEALAVPGSCGGPIGRRLPVPVKEDRHGRLPSRGRPRSGRRRLRCSASSPCAGQGRPSQLATKPGKTAVRQTQTAVQCVYTLCRSRKTVTAGYPAGEDRGAAPRFVEAEIAPQSHFKEIEVLSPWRAA